MPFLRPLISPWATLLWFALLALLATRAFKRQRDEISLSLRITLLALRIAAGALLGIWLLQPYRRTQELQDGASQLGILADASASMHIRRDCEIEQGTVTRWQAACAAMENALTPQNSLKRRFGGATIGLAPWSGVLDSSILPGDTDLGAALDAMRKEAELPGALPLNGIVLLSDGRQWGDALGAARRLAAAHIPVSTLCLGSDEIPSDLSISFDDDTPTEIPTHEQGEAHILVKSTFSRVITTKVTLLDAARETLAERVVEIPANGEQSVTMPFPVSDTPGETIFTARLESLPEDGNPVNDSCDHILDYKKPPEMRSLFLGANPGWEWRFIRMALERADTFRLSALIRLGLPDPENDKLPPDWKPNLRFYKLNCECPDAFPSTAEFYRDFDVVIIPCETASFLTQEEQTALRNFVEHQGGGLLWFGDASTLPESLSTLVPGDDFEKRTARLSGKAMPAAEDLIFEGVLSQPVALIPGSSYTICRNPRRIARTVLKDERGSAILLAEGNYGAGRVAWSGIEESWRWALNGEGALHGDFWRQLVSWLSANKQPQLELDLPENGLTANQENTIAIRVLGPDFRPAQAASVRLTANDREITMTPDLQEIGRYIGIYAPPSASAVRLDFEVKCAQETTPMHLEKFVTVNSEGQEFSEVTPDETLMRDIARITGGKILTMPIDWNDLPQSENVPRITKDTPLLPDAAFLILTAAIILCEYALRRRNAQK